MKLVSIDPSTGLETESWPNHTRDEVEGILDSMESVFLAWSRESISYRQRPMLRLADLLESRQDELATLMAREMGKPKREGKGEVAKCAWVCRFYAERAEEFLQPHPVATDAKRSEIHYRPLGIVLAIMPWNFPLWQVFRAAAPNLMAGNAFLLKHASNVTKCALAIEELLIDAGFPKGLARTLLLPGRQMGSVIEDSRVKGVTLTGSTPAGRLVAANAGQALKKTVLELGGSDPCVVLADADIDLAVSQCLISRFLNAGQSCIAGKRFIVESSVFESFRDGLLEKIKHLVVGSPMDETTDIGPLARRDLRDELHDQVQRSVAAGARVLHGGECPSGPGAFYPPTILTNVVPGQPAFDEELFGPVAVLVRAKDASEAIRLANQTPFGLGASIFTRDEEKGLRLASEELNAGSCFINAFVRSDPRLPFGGIKDSGWGRELGQAGILEFVNIKTVYLA